ncbi:MAG: portal protein [Geminicoccaceae bacterium]
MASNAPRSEIVPFERKSRDEISDDQLVNILQSEITNSLGSDWGENESEGYSSDLSEQRARGIDDYYGRPIGNEVAGRSQVILTEIADTIDWMMPSLMELFTSNNQVCTFKPRRNSQKDTVDQAAALVNHMIMVENDGFNLIYDFIHTGLLSKTGVFKVWYEDEPEPERESYDNLDLDGFMALVETPDRLEIIEPTDDIVDLFPLLMQGGTVDVVVLRYKSGKIMLDTVAPENFGISYHSTSVEDATLAFEVNLMAKSDLVEIGIPQDLVVDLPGYEGSYYSEERRARIEGDEGSIEPFEQGQIDDSRREVLVYESYLLVDADGDGVSEMMRILMARGGERGGFTILDKEEVEMERPFVTWTPFRMPYKFYGQSVPDKMHDVQVIKSTLARLGLDNANNVNINRAVVDPTSINMEDMQTNNLSGLVKMTPKAAARGVLPAQAVHPLTSVPILDQVMPMLEYFDQVRRGRMGVDPNSQDTTVENLSNQTSGVAISLIQDSARKKQQLIARHIANALEKVCQRILTLAIRNGLVTEIEVSDGEFERVDPGDWQEDMIAAVDVGLGFGSKERELAAIGNLSSMQAQAVAMQGGTLDGPLVRASHIAETGAQLVSASQLGRTGDFFGNPEELREMEREQDANPQPSPQEQMEMQAAELELKKGEFDVQKSGADVLKARAEAEKAKIEALTARLQPMQDAKRDQVNLVREMRGADLDREKARIDYTLKIADSKKADRIDELKLVTEDNQKRRDRLLKLREIESKENLARMNAGVQRAESAEQRDFDAQARTEDAEREDAAATGAGSESEEADNKSESTLEAVQMEALESAKAELQKATAALEAEKLERRRDKAKAGKEKKQTVRQSEIENISFVYGEDGRISGAKLKRGK